LAVTFPKNGLVEEGPLTLREQQGLEAAARQLDGVAYLGVMLCLHAGMLLGEVCGLKWEDIDLQARTLTVCRTLQRVALANPGGGPKTQLVFLPPTAPRVISLPPRLSALLKEQEGGGGYVLSANGKPMEPRVFQYRFKKILQAADLPAGNCRATRTTFMARALENGLDVNLLEDMLGMRVLCERVGRRLGRNTTGSR
jgi:integrase